MGADRVARSALRTAMVGWAGACFATSTRGAAASISNSNAVAPYADAHFTFPVTHVGMLHGRRPRSLVDPNCRFHAVFSTTHPWAARSIGWRATTKANFHAPGLNASRGRSSLPLVSIRAGAGPEPGKSSLSSSSPAGRADCTARRCSLTRRARDYCTAAWCSSRRSTRSARRLPSTMQ